jgi:O-antigen/teichoic acid export membrane protein
MAVSVLGLVQTKVFAIFLGPSGVGVFGLLVQFINLTSLLSGLGMQNAAIKDVSLARSEGNKRVVSSTIFLILIFAVGTSTATALILVLFAGPIAKWLIPSGDYQLLFVIFAISLPVMAARNVLLNILLGFKHVRHNAISRVIPAAFGAAIVYSLVKRFDINGAALFYLFVTISGFAVGVHYVLRLFRENGLPGPFGVDRPSWRPPSLGGILRFSITTQLNEILQLVAGFIVPMMIVWYTSTTVNGYFQVFISFWGYIYLLQSSMYGYFFPLVSETGTLTKLAEDMNRAIRLQMLITVSLVATIILAAPIAVRWIYATTFLAVAPYLSWLGIPAVAAVFGSVCGVCILGKGRLTEYTAQNTLKALAPVALGIVLIPRFGLSGAILSFASGAAVEGAFSYWIVAHRMGCRIGRQGTAVVLSGVAVLLLQYGATRAGGVLFAFTGFAMVVCWALIIVVSDQEIYQAMRALRSGAA